MGKDLEGKEIALITGLFGCGGCLLLLLKLAFIFFLFYLIAMGVKCGWNAA